MISVARRMYSVHGNPYVSRPIPFRVIQRCPGSFPASFQFRVADEFRIERVSSLPPTLNVSTYDVFLGVKHVLADLGLGVTVEHAFQ